MNWPGESSLRRCIRFDQPVSFTFTDENLRNHIELTQSEYLVLFVDAVTLAVTGIGSHGRDDDLYRAMRCRRLAGAFKGIVAHARGGKHVEVYDSEALRLWYDGYAWHANPFEVVASYLNNFFTTDQDLAGRAVGVLFELLDRQASSIIAFIPDEATLRKSLLERRPRGPSVTRGRQEKGARLLTPMRPSIESRLVSGRSIKVDLSLSALAGLLRVDGAHVIDKKGNLLYLAHKIVAPGYPEEKQFPGTGREAASRLSYWIEKPGFVVKVSASGTVYVFSDGRRVSDPIPALIARLA